MGPGRLLYGLWLLIRRGVVGMVFPYPGISCQAAIAASNYPPSAELTRISLLQWPAGSGHSWLCIYSLPSRNRLGKDVFLVLCYFYDLRIIYPLYHRGISDFSSYLSFLHLCVSGIYALRKLLFDCVRRTSLLCSLLPSWITLLLLVTV